MDIIGMINNGQIKVTGQLWSPGKGATKEVATVCENHNKRIKMMIEKYNERLKARRLFNGGPRATTTD